MQISNISQLKELINICIKNYDSRPKELKYKYKSINYNIPFRDIIYIEKEQDNKRCIIHTFKEDYYIQSTLNIDSDDKKIQDFNELMVKYYKTKNSDVKVSIDINPNNML